METVVLNLETVNLTDEQFYHLCQANQTWNLERNQKGELLIMPPVGGNSGKQEANLIVKVGVWNEQTQLGEVFSSSTIFRLPNGGDRSPDVAWIKRERWEALSAEEREKFPPFCYFIRGRCLTRVCFEFNIGRITGNNKGNDTESGYLYFVKTFPEKRSIVSLAVYNLSKSPKKKNQDFRNRFSGYCFKERGNSQSQH